MGTGLEEKARGGLLSKMVELRMVGITDSDEDGRHHRRPKKTNAKTALL